MTEHVNKDTLLSDTQKGYDDFEQLLSQLTLGQILAASGNGEWSVKDNIAHLMAWQRRTINLLQSVRDNRELPDPTPNMSEDEINAMFYQQNKTLSLDKVLANLHSVQQQTISALQSLSEEDLNKPISWLGNRPVVGWVVGNNSEHYQEHTHYIQKSLQQTKSV